MWDCFMKQKYAHLHLNMNVTQLFRVSSCFLELTLLFLLIIVSDSFGASYRAPPQGAPRADRLTQERNSV